MLKNFLIKCAMLLNRDDIIVALQNTNDISDIENEQIRNDILRLINYFNYTFSSLCENYLEITHTQPISSDSNKNIYYYKFDFAPLKILYIYDEFNNVVNFKIYSDHILLSESNKTYFVNYKYLPPEISTLDSELKISDILKKILCYGVVSEFLASKNLFNESEFWKTKFLNEIFKVRNKRERRFKSTFCKWNNQVKVLHSLTLKTS